MKYIEKYWIIIIIAFGFCMFIKPALCMLIIGFVAFYIGVETVIFYRKIQKKGVECIGKIIEYQSDDEGYKTPLVEFTPISGEYVKEKPTFYASSDLSKIRSYKNMIDQTVSVLYDPDDPKRFILTNEKEFNYFFLTFLFLVSLGFLIVGISSLLGYIKLK